MFEKDKPETFERQNEDDFGVVVLSPVEIKQISSSESSDIELIV